MRHQFSGGGLVGREERTEIPPLEKGVQGDVLLSGFRACSEQDIPRQPVAAAPFKGGI
jgi:hypothetical protein